MSATRLGADVVVGSARIAAAAEARLVARAGPDLVLLDRPRDGVCRSPGHVRSRAGSGSLLLRRRR
jgi:hypothetical protein